HCGTQRPADETLCPRWGNPWIDTTIEDTPPPDAEPPPAAPTTDAGDVQDVDSDEPPTGAVVAAGTAATVVGSSDSGDGESGGKADGADASDTGQDSGSDETGEVELEETAATAPPQPAAPPPAAPRPEDTGEFAFDVWTQPIEEVHEPRRGAWLVSAGLAVAILVAVAFFVFGGDNASTTTTIAALSTTTVAPVSTTATTVPPTTTTTAAIVFPQPGDWPPSGDPIDTAELTLKQSAIGPIDIGTPIDDVAGALTASLGEATASDIDGLCPPDESYRLHFGQLTAIFDGFDSSSVFVSYRYEEPQGTDEELGLKTLSGIAIGDTVEDLINTYTQFTISFEILDSKDHFRLSDGEELLLWGPVSSVDPAGVIEGLYSPTACDTTP
ncbi:MAG: hypothetical protein ABFR53_05780, partial [Actinomycetota bacterium]